MENFIAKAYINNYRSIVSERVLIEQLEGLGYKHIADDQRDTIIILNGIIDEVYSSPYDNWDELGYINCRNYANGDEGLAVKLFLYLATMKSELTTRTMVRWVKKIPLPNMPSVAIRTIGDISPLFEWVDGNESCYEVLTPHQFAEAVMRGDVEF